MPFVEATFRAPQVRVPHVGMPLHVGVPHVGMPHVGMPHVGMPHVGRDELGRAGHVAKSWLPDRDRGLLYGGLGGMAVLGLIDWPVAAAVAAGAAVTERVVRRQRSAEATARPRKTAAREKTTTGAD